MLDDQQPQPLPRPTSEQLKTVHRICERFEKSWRSGQSVTIEQLLSESTVDVRPYLLEALVRSEIELLESSGQTIEPGEYLRRFSSESGIIARAFMSPDKLEQLDSGDNYESIVDEASRAADSSKPLKLGHFEIRDEIARGGMGVVYRGWHDELKREVAVKCIRAGGFADEAMVQRFRREAQTVASLNHDGIVPIYEVGNEQGLYYFVMPLIEGDSLGTHLTRGPIEHRRLARMVHDAALATQFAHEHGIIHRDIKPSNILVDQQDKVWVADFGLATTIQTNEGKDSTDDKTRSDLSVSGTIVGTPAYMAPEQTQGKANELTDVYGLGAVLYTGLTGRPPHRAGTLVQTLKQVNEVEPVAPRTLDANIPRDLETIALKALSKSPSQRYATAKDLADDLTRYLEGHTILAKPASSLERIWRWMKREPVVAGLAAGIILALAIGLGVSLRFYSLALANSRMALNNEKLAQESVQEYLTQVADSPELGEKGLEDLRGQLLQSALVFYERLAAQSPDSLPLQERVADAHERLGKIQALIGQPDKAVEQFQKMLLAYDELRVKYPVRLDYERACVEALIQQAEVVTDQSEYEQVGLLLGQAIKRCRDLEQSTGELADRITLASLYSLEIANYTSTANTDAAKQTMPSTTQLCEELVKSVDKSLSPFAGRRLLRTLDRMASQLQNVGDFEATERCCRLGIELCGNTIFVESQDMRTRLIEGRLYKNLNLLYTRTNRLDLAVTEYELSNKIFTELLNEHPLIFEVLDQKATLVANAAGMYSLLNKPEEAEKLIKEAIEMQKLVIARQPNVIGHWNGLSNAYATQAVFYRNSFRLPEAEAAVKLGIQANEKLREADSKDAGTLYFGFNLRLLLGETYVAQKRYPEAVAILRPLTEEVSTFLEKNQAIPNYRHLAASAFRSLASNERVLKNFVPARQAAEQSIAHYEALPPQATSMGLSPRILTDALYTRGVTCILDAKHDEARAAISRALAILDPIVDNPKTPPAATVLFRAPRAEFYDLAGQIAAAENDHEKAVEEFNRALAEQQAVNELVKAQPVVLRMNQERQALVQIHLARSLVKLQKFDDAIKSCDIAIEMKNDAVEEAKTLRAEIEKGAK